MTIDNTSKTWKKLSKIKPSGTLNQKAIVMFPRIQDTKKELILDYLEHYEGSMVCSRQLYSEALGNDGNPAQWEIREINDIMNNCSDWTAFSNPRHFPEPYRRQKGWEKPDNRGQDFQPITKEQMEQLSLPPEWME